MDDLTVRLGHARARSLDLGRQGVRLRLQSSITVLRSEDLVLGSQVDRHLRRHTPPAPGPISTGTNGPGATGLRPPGR